MGGEGWMVLSNDRGRLSRQGRRIDCGPMKPDPQPSPFKKFEDALRKVLSAPKKDVDKAIAREKKEREARKTEQPK